MKSTWIVAVAGAVVVCLGAGVARAEEDIAATAAKEWRAYVEPLAPIAERLVPKMSDPSDPQLRRELYRSLFQQIATGYLALLYADPKHPDFWPYFDNAFNMIGPNPDNSYYVTPLDDGGVYKIAGYRGTVKRIVFQLGNGSFVPQGVVDANRLGGTLANYDADELKIDKNGYFEVILSPTRPTGYKGNWLKLPPKTSYLFMRQVSYDWINEVSGRFGIERLDQPAAKPRMTSEELEKKLKHVAYWTESLVKVSMDFRKLIQQKGWVNKVDYLDLTAEYGGMVTQKYLYGIFDLAPDEALIVESEVPKECRYWSIHLTDDLFYTLDYHRPTSVNGFTAKVDKDRKVRFVISAQDPGVPNWMDTLGYRTGVIQGRWELCSSWPKHVATKVKVADVRKYLPKETPTITAEQRDATIRQRRLGVQMRKRW